MKRFLILFTTILVIVPAITKAQYKLDEGDAQLNFGMGFSTKWGTPFYVGVDFGVHRNISIGAEATYRAYIDDYSDRQSVAAFLVNGNFHFSGLLAFPEEWDPYMGLNLGIAYRDNLSTGIKSTLIGFGGQVGVRYYFTDNLGFNLELGGATIFDWGKIGLTYVFR